MNGVPLALSICLSTIKGLVKQPELVKGLQRLTCSAEGCSLNVTENENGAFIVSLDCPKSMPAAEPWSIEPAPDRDHYIYRAIFETETTNSMIESIEQLLKLPPIKGSFTKS